ncbi:hypothetical protein GUJ93_ZPchr0004g38470 [Zizania palustris]|uniref:Uncharacterized protein n=1 Tax=Zizania palustris TaxID=103762 RepID=A0A8J5SXX4_ZIZPA|nr:hypothetical protein GUJ93_ZPchr0004g38470 [Zizania palustris]
MLPSYQSLSSCAWRHQEEADGGGGRQAWVGRGGGRVEAATRRRWRGVARQWSTGWRWHGEVEAVGQGDATAERKRRGARRRAVGKKRREASREGVGLWVWVAVVGVGPMRLLVGATQVWAFKRTQYNGLSASLSE